MKQSFRRSLLSFCALAASATLFTTSEARAAAVVVPVSGTVTDAAGAMTLKGTATVDTTLVKDEFGGAPTVLVSVRLNNVIGHGATAASVLQGSGEAVLVRPLGSSDTVEVSVALDSPGNSPGTATRTATATIALSLDPVTGAALAATGSFAP
jgi:hypothetical protein